MARRAQKGINKILIALSALVITGAGFLIVYLVGGHDDSMRTVSPLNISDYINKATELAGTEGTVTGVVAEKLRWTPDRGEMISVAVNLEKNSVHGSDAPETAAFEISYFFNQIEILA